MFSVLILIMSAFLDVDAAPPLTTKQNRLIQSNKFSCVGKANGFYPNPYSCDSYYICVSQISSELHCARGLLYNIKTKFCDWPQNVQCVNQQPIVSSTVHHGVQTTNNPFIIHGPTKLLVFTNAPIKTNTQAKTSASTNIPTLSHVTTKAQTKMLIFGNSYTSTNSPVHTNIPVPTIRPTPSIVNTNQPTKVLMFTNIPLNTNKPVLTKVPFNTNSPTKLLVFTNKPAATNPPVTTKVPVFTRQPTHAPQRTTTMTYLGTFCHGKQDGLYRDPNACGYYYQCAFGLTYHEPCADGTVYNEKADSCDYPYTVPACVNYHG